MGWTALIDDNGKGIGMVGDTVWDIMGEAFEKIIEEYQRVWSRNPTAKELMSIVEFSFPDEVMDE